MAIYFDRPYMSLIKRNKFCPVGGQCINPRYPAGTGGGEELTNRKLHPTITISTGVVYSPAAWHKKKGNVILIAGMNPRL